MYSSHFISLYLINNYKVYMLFLFLFCMTLSIYKIKLFKSKSFPQVVLASNQAKKKRGVLAAINKTTDFVLHEKLSDPKGRYLILICTIAGSKYTLACIYSPNLCQIHFLNRVLKKNQLTQTRLLDYMWGLQHSTRSRIGNLQPLPQTPVFPC